MGLKWSNEGLGYNPSTGIFTAPNGGIYVFDWTILSWLGQQAHTLLVVNNQFKSGNFCYNGRSETRFPCSKMLMMKLNQEDKFWIGVFDGPANIHYQYTSFSGYKPFTKCTQKIFWFMREKNFQKNIFFIKIDADFVCGYNNKSSINTLWCLWVFLWEYLNFGVIQILAIVISSVPSLLHKRYI